MASLSEQGSLNFIARTLEAHGKFFCRWLTVLKKRRQDPRHPVPISRISFFAQVFLVGVRMLWGGFKKIFKWDDLVFIQKGRICGYS